jgi:hypothetical protein
MPRLIKKTVVLAKIETTSGTDAVPTGAANAIQVMDLTITPLDIKTADMSVVTPWFGGSAGLAATAPAWGALMVGCAHAETTGLTTPNRVEYLPATDLLKTLSIYWYDDGLLHKLLGVSGTVKLSAKSGEAPKLTFDFVGLDAGVNAIANATAVLTGWKTPPTVTKANVTDINIGCTYAAGVLTGGTSYNSTGLTLDWGNAVNFVPMLTNEQVVLTDRDVKGSMSLDLTAAQEVAMYASVKANTTQGIGFVIGKTSGNQIMLHMPAAQLLNPKKEEINGMRLIGFDVHLNPVNGNDEIRIISL